MPDDAPKLKTTVRLEAWDREVVWEGEVPIAAAELPFILVRGSRCFRLWDLSPPPSLYREVTSHHIPG